MNDHSMIFLLYVVLSDEMYHLSIYSKQNRQSVENLKEQSGFWSFQWKLSTKILYCSRLELHNCPRFLRITFQFDTGRLSWVHCGWHSFKSAKFAVKNSLFAAKPRKDLKFTQETSCWEWLWALLQTFTLRCRIEKPSEIVWACKSSTVTFLELFKL